MKHTDGTEITQHGIETRAIVIASISSVIAFVIGLVIFGGQMTPIFGRDSIGLTTAIFVAFVVAISFTTGLYTVHPRVRELRTISISPIGRIRRWVKLIALAFVFSALGFLLCSVVFFVFQQAFIGVTFDMWAGSALLATSVAVCAYTSYLISVSLTPILLSGMLAVFLAAGVLTNAISVSDPYWWQYHFSSLGAGGTPSSVEFNITLIVSGLVIWVLAGLIADDLIIVQRNQNKLYPHRTALLRAILIMIGFSLSMVGLFVYNVYPTIHNTSAGLMAVLFVGLIAGLRFVAPTISRSFYLISYAMLAILIVCIVLFYGVGYFNLTTFELSAAVVIFGWIVMLVRQISAQRRDAGDVELYIDTKE